MAEESDQIRDDIELTRTQLAHDVDRLADKTVPSRVAQRQWDRAKAKVRGVSDRVMGSAHGNGSMIKDKASDALGTVQDKTADVAEQVKQAPAAINRQTQGNPVAAGLIAFGAGLLVASLMPASNMERRAGQQLRDHADDLIEPVRQPLTESMHQIRDDMGDSAKEAAASVRDTAKDAAQTTASAAKDATSKVKHNATRTNR
jgi:gas vesicle protein